jgi:hypothetical protein
VRPTAPSVEFSTGTTVNCAAPDSQRRNASSTLAAGSASTARLRAENEALKQHYRKLQDAYQTLYQELTRRGVHLGGEGLQPSATATTVKIEESGDQIVSDGPFAETKEQLLGFYVVDYPTIDDAIAAARELRRANPTAVYEIRPIRLYLPGESLPETSSEPGQG